MKIHLLSVMVDDQAKALAFYTDVLGFVTEHDISMGEFRWLTVVSPEGPAEVALLLEPMGIPAAAVFQKALFDAGIPAVSFAVSDIAAEHSRLAGMGVSFRMEPTVMGPVSVAVLADTCGNWVQLVQR